MLPTNGAAAQAMSAFDYIMSFQKFARAIQSTPEKLQSEMNLLVSNYPELATGLAAFSQLSQLQQQAAIGSIDELKEMVRSGIKQNAPQATEEQIEQAVMEQVAQFSRMGMNDDTLKQVSEQAKQQLAAAKQQLGQPASQVIGDKVVTQDRLKSYMEERAKQIEFKIAEAELNRKDYEAQSDLIYSLFMKLAR
jgi:hypothetical protein